MFYKFLKLEIDGRRLLDCLLDDDPDLRAALSDDDALAQEWASAFKGLVRPATSYSSHGLAKQLYWCVTGEPSKDEDFHLLQPSFSSALAHAVHADISDARFGEANVQARQAMRSKEACASDYRDYRGLVARKLGGTKPQNISQLNSERGGVNYLLASLPPRWDQDQPRQFLGIQSALDRFRRYEGVSSLVTALCHFLASNPDPTMETRVERERIEQALGTSLAAFGLTVQGSFVPGWTRDENCRLSHCQKLWLDPGRAELPPRSEHKDEDDAFACDFTRQDWPDEVAMQFGNWLNDILERRGLPVGTVEYTHWVKQAIVDVTEWPATMQRRPIATQEEEGAHV
ncbi:MAG: type I-F CRISPR-associated protein Csy1 [Rhodocyclaceae bacterium]